MADKTKIERFCELTKLVRFLIGNKDKKDKTK